VDRKGPTSKVVIVKGCSLMQQMKFRVRFKCSIEFGCRQRSKRGAENKEDFESDMIMLKIDNQKHLGQVRAKDLQIIGEWQEYFSRMEKEMPNLEVIVSSLQKAKDEACKELEKVDGQIETQLKLVAT